MKCLAGLLVSLLCSLVPAQELQSPQVLQWTAPGSNVYDLTLAIYRPLNPVTWPQNEDHYYNDIYGQIWTFVVLEHVSSFSYWYIGGGDPQILPTNYLTGIKIPNTQYGPNPEYFQMLNGQPITGELWGWGDSGDYTAFAATIFPGQQAGRFIVATFEVPPLLIGARASFFHVGWYHSDSDGFVWFANTVANYQF